MKYTVHKAIVEVIGKVWLPPVTCAMVYTLKEHDLKNLGKWTRKNVEQWVMGNSGDFQSIEDFRADFDAPGRKHWESNWSKPESEITFNDCMYGEGE